MLTVSKVFEPKFDEVSHRYTYDGVILPSVTQILKPISMIEYARVDPETMRIKAELGTAVHSCIEYLIDDDLDESSIDLSWLPYIQAWKTWRDFYKPKFWFKELRLGCSYFCGTIDCVCEINGELVVIDWKTTEKLMKTTGPQTAGYELVARCWLNLPSMLNRAVLQLKDNGQFVFKRFTDVQDYTILENLLMINQWMNK